MTSCKTISFLGGFLSHFSSHSSFLWRHTAHTLGHFVKHHVYLFVAGLVPDDLRGHPGHGASKAHLGAVLRPLAGRSKVANLDHLVLPNQNTEKTMDLCWLRSFERLSNTCDIIFYIKLCRKPQIIIIWIKCIVYYKYMDVK